MNVIIVEDEINNVEVLTHLINNYCEDVSIIGSAGKVQEGITLIKSKNPDLILLDVELEDGTGFDVLKGLEEFRPKVIFITGYEHYAIEAIKMSAIDYILKPVNIEELKKAIEKGKTLQLESAELAALQSKIKELEPTYIWLNGTKKSQKIDADTIEYIKADSVYSEIHLDSEMVKYASFSLSHFEEVLKEKNFFRIHKSYIVNLAKISEVEAGRGGNILLSSGKKIPIAYRRKVTLKQFLG